MFAYHPKYSLAAVTMYEAAALQVLLENGWEPFAVAPSSRPDFDMIYLRKAEWLPEEGEYISGGDVAYTEDGEAVTITAFGDDAYLLEEDGSPVDIAELEKELAKELEEDEPTYPLIDIAPEIDLSGELEAEDQ